MNSREPVLADCSLTALHPQALSRKDRALAVEVWEASEASRAASQEAVHRSVGWVLAPLDLVVSEAALALVLWEALLVSIDAVSKLAFQDKQADSWKAPLASAR